MKKCNINKQTWGLPNEIIWDSQIVCVFSVFKCPLNAKQSMSTQDLVFHNKVEVLSYL